jgi:hypothetical protein
MKQNGTKLKVEQTVEVKKYFELNCKVSFKIEQNLVQLLVILHQRKSTKQSQEAF